MPLTILGRADVSSLLSSLNRDETKQVQDILAEALQHYSTENQKLEDGPISTAERIAVQRPGGVNTTIAPIATKEDTGLRVKTVQDETGFYRDHTGRRTSTPRPRSLRDSVDQARSQFGHMSVSPSPEHSRSHSGSHPRPTTPPALANNESEQTKNHTPISGYLTILNPTGLPTGLLNAEDISAFRTALTSLLLFNRRHIVETVTVFGAGRLAYWHIRLALVLRGSEIKRVNIINRSFERSSHLLREFYSPEQKEWRGDVKFSAFSLDCVEYNRLLMDSIQKADVIFGCTSSPEPLFPAEILTSDGASTMKGRYICATGSRRASAAELDPDIFRDAVEPQRSQRHWLVYRKRPARSGVVLVDSIDACLQRGGEIIQSELEPRQLVEIGELVMLRDISAQQGHYPDKGLHEWVEKGNVVYKGTGLDMLDLVLSKYIVERAVERGVGTTVNEF